MSVAEIFFFLSKELLKSGKWTKILHRLDIFSATNIIYMLTCFEKIIRYMGII